MNSEKPSPADAAQEVFRLEGELDDLKRRLVEASEIQDEDLYEYLGLTEQLATGKAERTEEATRAQKFSRDAVYAANLEQALRVCVDNLKIYRAD